MGIEQTLTLSQIQRIADAVSIVADNSAIPFKTAYKLGLLGNYCEAPIAAAKKAKTTRVNKYNQERTELLKGFDEKKEKEPSREIQDKLTDLANKLNEDILDLDQEEHQIKVPDFTLSEFVATEEVKTYITIKTKEEQKVETITFKKGQSIVPVHFFRGMGELIKQD